MDYQTSDGRFLFYLPWQGHTLIGTTDKKTTAETLPTPPEQEVDWLLKEGSKYLNLELRREHVLSAWRGWRPLVADPHAPPDAPVSRDHVISVNPTSGVIFIAGGKWTTWREMAQEAVDRVVGKGGPPCKTLGVTLFGGGPGCECVLLLLLRLGNPCATTHPLLFSDSDSLAAELEDKYPHLDTDVASHLAKTYGVRAWEVCKVSTQHERITPGYPYIEAEVVYGCREYACTVEDILSRRTRLAYLNRDEALAAIPKVTDLMAKELGWSRSVKAQQAQAAKKYIESYGGPTTGMDENPAMAAA